MSRIRSAVAGSALAAVLTVLLSTTAASAFTANGTGDTGWGAPAPVPTVTQPSPTTTPVAGDTGWG